MNTLFLNLLPPEKKARINELVNFILIKNILEISAFVTAISGIFILGGWLVVVEGYNDLAESAIAINKEYGIQNQETRNINKILHNINNSAENYYPLTDKLAALMNATPNGIKLNLINIDRTGQRVTIGGNAANRDLLLSYQTTLENTGWLTKINSPSSQLFQKENISFEIITKLNIPPTAPPTNGSPAVKQPAESP